MGGCVLDDDCDDGMGFDLTRRESRIEDDDIDIITSIFIVSRHRSMSLSFIIRNERQVERYKHILLYNA